MKRGFVPMRHGLDQDYEVWRIAYQLAGCEPSESADSIGALRATVLRVVGSLHFVWSWVDQHHDSEVVRLSLPTLRHFIDDSVRWPGFTDALVSVGWLAELDGETCQFPGVEAWIGETARRRAKDRDRKRNRRGHQSEKIARKARRGPCVYCESTVKIEADHFFPLAVDGLDVAENLLPACRLCNQAKGKDSFETIDEARKFIAKKCAERFRWNSDGTLADYPTKIPTPPRARATRAGARAGSGSGEDSSSFERTTESQDQDSAPTRRGASAPPGDPHYVPDAFELTPELRAYAETHLPAEIVSEVFEVFRHRRFEKPVGEPSKRWKAYVASEVVLRRERAAQSRGGGGGTMGRPAPQTAAQRTFETIRQLREDAQRADREDEERNRQGGAS